MKVPLFLPRVFPSVALGFGLTFVFALIFVLALVLVVGGIRCKPTETIAALAHRLASSCLAFGLMALGARLRETEAQVKAGSVVTLNADELNQLCADSLAQLKDHLN